MLIKVMAVQSQLGRPLTMEEKLHIFKQRPDFVCLPEYCLIGRDDPDFTRSASKIKDNLTYLRNLSLEFSTCLIGGSVVEADQDSLYNSAYIFDRGDFVGRYRKLNPVSGEMEKGILPGDKLFTATVDEVRIAVLICADALNLRMFDLLYEKEVDIIFIPTTSPYRPAESKAEKHKRDREIYLAGAVKASAYIVKTCAIGPLFGKPLQGRSIIASPWGFIERVPTYAEMNTTMLTAVLDIDEIRDFRRKKKEQAAPAAKNNLNKKGAV